MQPSRTLSTTVPYKRPTKCTTSTTTGPPSRTEHRRTTAPTSTAWVLLLRNASAKLLPRWLHVEWIQSGCTSRCNCTRTRRPDSDHSTSPTTSSGPGKRPIADSPVSPSKSATPLSTRRIRHVVGSPLLPTKVNGVLAPKTILDTGAVLTVLRVGLLPPANVSTFLNLQDFNGGISSVRGPREVVFTFAGLKMTFSVYESSTMAEDCIIGTDMVFHFDIATRLAANSITVHRDDRGVLEQPKELPVKLEHEDTPSLFAASRVFFKVRACQSVALQPISSQIVPLHVITSDSMKRTTAKGDKKTGDPAYQTSHPRNVPARQLAVQVGRQRLLKSAARRIW